MRRQNGEGHYGKVKINGYDYFYFTDSKGYRTYARTMKDLKEKLKSKTGKIKTKKAKQTFYEYCKDWLKSRHGYITDGTYDTYEDIINSRIQNTFIGNAYPGELRLEMFNDYLQDLKEKYSKGYIDKIWMIIKQILKYGMERSEIPNFSVDKIKKPKEDDVVVKKKKIPFITEHDMNALYAEMQTGRYGNAAKLLIFIQYSGVRISEATALKWDSVAKDMKSITIDASSRRNVIRDENLEPIKDKDGNKKYKTIQKTPKTKDSQRVIPLPERATEMLKWFYDNYEHRQQDFVFVTQNKTQYNKRTVERTLERMLKNSKCDRKDYTPHCLRHGYGSVLISKGVDIKIVSELLGHSDVAFTYNVYIGILNEDKRKAVDVFDK